MHNSHLILVQAEDKETVEYKLNEINEFGNEYSVKVIKNNCIDLDVEEIEVDETEERR